MASRLYISVLFGVFVMAIAKASYIELKSDTSVIYPILTKKLQIRCVIRKDENVGQRSATQTPLYNLITANLTQNPSERVNTSARKPSDEKSSSSHADLFRLLSIVITVGDRENIASVTGCDAPIVEKTFSAKILADGSCDSSPGNVEQGYLLLTLDRPLAKHAGTFTCEASALDSEKNPISIKTSLNISTVEPTLTDVVEYIAINDKHIADLEEQVVQLRAESAAIKDRESNLTSKLEYLNYNLVSMKGQNIQTGNATCQKHTIAFMKPYKVPPTVFVSVPSVSANSNYFTSYYVTVEDIKTKSFTVNCVLGNYLSVTFQWLAFDN